MPLIVEVKALLYVTHSWSSTAAALEYVRFFATNLQPKQPCRMSRVFPDIEQLQCHDSGCHGYLYKYVTKILQYGLVNQKVYLFFFFLSHPLINAMFSL